MKVLALNSSPRMEKGNTALLLGPFLDGVRGAGAQVDLVYVRKLGIKPCTGCFSCWNKTPGRCPQKDDMEQLYTKLMGADVWVLATPLYECGMTGTLKVLLDRTVACHGPGCADEKPEKLVLVSSCGDWALERFDALVFYMRDLCKNIRKEKGCEFAGALLRPHAAAMKFMMDAKMPVADIFTSARQAGLQLVKNGRMEPETLANVARPLCTKQEFAEASGGK
ncbi:MAG: flavodoxin family protein [Elusimicrobia bacterium]|nr:flavodoxin family protein [Elusimicrobiota bacterium]